MKSRMDPNKLSRSLSRRDFLKLSGLGLGALAFRPLERAIQLPNFPVGERLGRVAVGGRVEVYSAPDEASATVKTIYEDAVVEWLREVTGTKMGSFSYNRRWVETPEGFVFASFLQPVQNRPNENLSSLPPGSPDGFWAEVTVPYVDLELDNPPARSPWLQDILSLGITPRLYYSQVIWIDRIRTGATGRIEYRCNERYGTYGDIFWAEGAAFRILTAEEVTPINPEAEEKRVVVNVNKEHQYLSCYEGKTEVYFCRISSGTKFNSAGQQVDNWGTPVGKFPTWRKLYSLHMSGGTTGGGWDLPGVAWTNLFVGNGVAIHSTFWHNDFGTPRSRGCVNASPEDAKWIFRWTLPAVEYGPGDVTIGMPGGTQIFVEEG